MNEQSIVWMLLLVIFLVIEFLTLGLTTIWLAGGALVAFFVSLAGGSLGVQTLLFLAVTAVLLVVTRPFAVRFINQNRTKTNIDSLIGTHAIVTEKIDNLQGQGQVQVGGQIWTARAKKEEEAILPGTKVRILAISGVKLIVEPADCGGTQ